jgi:hypothetical protein
MVYSTSFFAAVLLQAFNVRLPRQKIPNTNLQDAGEIPAQGTQNNTSIPVFYCWKTSLSMENDLQELVATSPRISYAPEHW